VIVVEDSRGIVRHLSYLAYITRMRHQIFSASILGLARLRNDPIAEFAKKLYYEIKDVANFRCRFCREEQGEE